MTQWHADVDMSAVATGARLTVVSQHHVVRVVTADTLSIETPDGQRFSAIVLDRTAGDLKLILDDGRPLRLAMMLDESLLAPGRRATVFSRQIWQAH